MKIILVGWLNLRIFFLKHAHFLMIGTQRTPNNPRTNFYGKLIPENQDTNQFVNYI